MMVSATDRVFDVVGLGVSTLDLFMVVDEFPDRELVQRAHLSLLQGGGPVATALVALSRLGCRTSMVDRLGDDWRGNLIHEEFKREGVATDRLSIAKGGSSSIASILVRRRDAARTIVYAPGDVEELLPAEIPTDLIASSRILHLNGRHLDASLAAARIARQNGTLVSFDGGAHRFHDRLRELVSLCDICVVARQFAQAFSGAADLEACACNLLAAGPNVVAITAGIQGSWVFGQNGDRIHQPPFLSPSAVDTTGAGDAFHAGFLYGVLNGYTLGASAEFASAVAALNTRELGGRTALPSLAETSRFLHLASRTN